MPTSIHTNTFLIEDFKLEVEIHCLQDYIDLTSDVTSSKQKQNILNLFSLKSFDCCISIGTGTCDDIDICNGSVLVGGNTCVYNPFNSSYDANLLSVDNYAKIYISSIIEQLTISQEQRNLILQHVLICPNLGGSFRRFEVSKNILGLAVANIVNFSDYAWADIEAVKKINEHLTGLDAISLDTTHGIIRMATDNNFIFFTGITNRIGKYEIDFEPNYYIQGYVAAFNCGVMFKALFPTLAKLI